MVRSFTKKDCLKSLKLFCKQFSDLTAKNYAKFYEKNPENPSCLTIIKKFETWNEALKKAGLLKNKKCSKCGETAIDYFQGEDLCETCLNPKFPEQHAEDFAQLKSPLGLTENFGESLEGRSKENFIETNKKLTKKLGKHNFQETWAKEETKIKYERKK